MRVYFYHSIRFGTWSLLLVGISMFAMPLQTYAGKVISIQEIPRQVKLGEISLISKGGSTFFVQTSSNTITSYYDRETMFYTGAGDVTTSEILQPGVTVYIFGIFDEVRGSMNVEKVVLKNKSKLARKTGGPLRAPRFARIWRAEGNLNQVATSEPGLSTSTTFVLVR